MKPSRTLISTITDRAKKSFTGDFNKSEDYEAWVRHWFKTAEAFRDELNQEGLVSTVAKVDEIIRDEKKISKYIPQDEMA